MTHRVEPDMNRQPQGTGMKRSPHWKKIPKGWFWILAVAAVAVLLILARTFLFPAGPGGRGQGQNNLQRPLPVTAMPTQKAKMDVNLKGLGTVVPVNTVIVRSQVSGQLLRVHFREGQVVQQGALLAEIDPRPFEVQRMQAEGQLARDQSLLKNAEVDLARYKELLAQDSIAAQQVSTQEALVEQYRGAVKTDEGQVASARLQLTYSRITAPVAGRIGLRLVDPGNMVQTSDQNGLLVITQLQPVTVVFSVPQDNLPLIMKKIGAGGVLPAFAYSQDGKTLLAKGKILAVDNQIDTTTGTVKIKAVFDNRGNKLFPNQFVNVVMKVDTLPDAVVMPTAAIQRGSVGTFAYVVNKDDSVSVRLLKLGPVEGENVAVLDGLTAGEVVVVVGGDKLREGSKVEVITKAVAGTPAPGSKGPRDGTRKNGRKAADR